VENCIEVINFVFNQISTYQNIFGFGKQYNIIFPNLHFSFTLDLLFSTGYDNIISLTLSNE